LIGSSGELATGYEVPAIDALLARGIAVVVTDYQGLGIPGIPHTYGSAPPEANAVIDAARAAQNLTGTGVPPDGPVGFFGYSQGGGATAEVASRVARYAPELDVVGTFSGDGLIATRRSFNYVEGRLASGYIGYYLNGLMYAFPETKPIVRGFLNDQGEAWLAGVRNQCIFQTPLQYGFKHTGQWTVSGKTVGNLLAGNATTRSAMMRTTVSSRPPADPVLITVGDNDDVIDPDVTRDLVNKWCRGGAKVELRASAIPPLEMQAGLGHILNIAYFYPQAITWLVDRFNGRPATDTCRT
jgi:hypothetical protein